MVEFERFMYGFFGSAFTFVGLFFGCLFALTSFILLKITKRLNQEVTRKITVAAAIAGMHSVVFMALGITATIYRVPDSIPMASSFVLEDIGMVDDHDVSRAGTPAWVVTKQGRYRISPSKHVVVGVPAYLTEQYYHPYICFGGEKRCHQVHSSVTYSNKL